MTATQFMDEDGHTASIEDLQKELIDSHYLVYNPAAKNSKPLKDQLCDFFGVSRHTSNETLGDYMVNFLNKQPH